MSAARYARAALAAAIAGGAVLAWHTRPVRRAVWHADNAIAAALVIVAEHALAK